MTTPDPERQPAPAADDPADELKLEVETLTDLDVPQDEAEELHGGKAPIGFTSRDEGGAYC